MKSTSYKTKKGINRMTLNHLVKGSNPLRPIDSTTIEDFTLDRSLDRQENHLEANPKAYKDYRDSRYKTAGVASPAPCQPKGENVKIIRIEECMDENHCPVCPWCSEIIIDDETEFVCDNPDSIGKNIEPCIESVHPDCPLPDAKETDDAG